MLVLLCVVGFTEEKYNSENFQELIYCAGETAIKWSIAPLTFTNQDLHDFFNTISAN